MAEENKNMEVWNKVKSPNPKYTKKFNRGGGFKGTATNTQYIIQQATEIFGMNGYGWGVDVIDEKYVEGAPVFIGDKEVCREIIHVVRGNIWYRHDGEICKTGQQYGQTTFVGKNKNGVFTDEEAPKKSITDMMLKCFSLLGFSADIFLGLYDDNKYVNDIKNKIDEREKTREAPIEERFSKAIDWITGQAKKDIDVDQFDLAVDGMRPHLNIFKGKMKKDIEATIADTRKFLEERVHESN